MKFNYPTVFKTLPDYTAHAGFEVEIVREATPDESDHHFDPELEPLYLIKASDGWEGFAFESELVR